MSVEKLLQENEIVRDNYRDKLRILAERSVSIDRTDWEVLYNHEEEIVQSVNCEHLRYIGDGFARSVFMLPSEWTIGSDYEFVAKFPLSEIERKQNTNGYKQNETEIQESANLFEQEIYPEGMRDIFCPVVDTHKQKPQSLWIVMPWGKPMKSQRSRERHKSLLNKLKEFGYAADVSDEGAVREFDQNDDRFVDLGTGISEKSANK